MHRQCRLPRLILGLVALLASATSSARPPVRCEGPSPPTHDSLYSCVDALPQPLQRREALLAFDADDIEAARHARGQMLAFVEAELGRYDDALTAYPFSPRFSPPQPAPTPSTHDTRAAAPVIAEMARERRIVLVNEAHHDAATRQLTLELLPLLRAGGYTHFAAETLDAGDVDLARRGYPIAATGGYTKEPLYGDIVRQALRLGYVIVPYESSGHGTNQQAREEGQAAHLKARVFDTAPDARLFVHAGYAHIDKAASPRLWNVDTMAVRLKALTGIDPLSIDQTLLRSWGKGRESTTATALIDAFDPQGPSVLIARNGGFAWSAAPQWHDVSVLLPRPTFDTARPRWLDLGGAREAWPIPRRLCREVRPCRVEARHRDEPDGAVPADRYAIVEPDDEASLYLRPGRYRVRALDRDGAPIGRERGVRIR